MTAQIRSELLKLVTVRTSLLFVLATTALTALLVVLQSVSAGGEFMGPLTDPGTQEALLGSAEPVTLIAIVFGCLALSSEFRHHTIVTTLLSDPRRGRVVVAKSVGALVAGAVLAAAAVLVALVGTWVVLQVTSTAFVVDGSQIVRGVGGTVAAGALGSLLGMGIGGVVRNQALAVGATLLLLLALEPLVGSLAPSVGRWMPSGLATHLSSGVAGAEPSLAAAAIVLGAYGAVAAVVAAVVLRRADVT